MDKIAKIKLLIMEDVPEDAELMVHSLENDGFEVNWVRCVGREKFLTYLDDTWDMILADHTLPQFDAIQALELMQEQGYDIPFIIVSGTISEEAAVEGLRLGATDYLLKDRLARLGPAVRSALKEQQLSAEKQRAEEALQKSERQFRLFAENAKDVIYRYRIEPSPQMEYISPSIEEITDYAVEEFYRDPELIFNIIHPEDLLKLEERLFTKQDFTEPLRVRWLKSDGTEIWMDHRSNPVSDASGKIIAIEGISRDITDMMELQQSLKRSERMFRGIFENIEEGYYRTTPDGKYKLVNPQYARILGYDSPEVFEGKYFNEFEHFDQYPREAFLQEIHQTGRIRNFHSTWIHRGGHEIIVRENAHIVYDEEENVRFYEGTVEDVTEQRQLEEQLIQSQKMESLGQIAGGIAHDFNNVLATLSGAIQMVSFEREQGDVGNVDRYLQMAKSGIEQAKSITERLLTFTQSGEPNVSAVSLQSFTAEMSEMISHALPKEIDIKVQQYEGKDVVQVEGTQLQQVLMNLCINASQAMDGKGTIKLGIRQPTEKERTHQGNQKPSGEFLCLTVSDSGQGIEPEVQERIFEPFFTTKRNGEGTGLGLAVSYKIIQNHGGWLTVESTPGEGATFIIGLPVAEQTTSKTGRDPTNISRGGGQHILVIDDEKQIRNLLTDFLENNGYVVTAVEDGQAGLARYKETPDTFHMILTDLGLPEMSGVEMSRRILDINPDAKIIAATGYIDTAERTQLESVGFQSIISKPFQLMEVLAEVNKILNSVS